MTTNKVKFADIAKSYGQVFIYHWEKSADLKYAEFLGIDNPEPQKQYLVFFPVPSVDNGIRCSNCGHAEWNAHNFGNLIHFCPNHEMQIEFTKFQVPA